MDKRGSNYLSKYVLILIILVIICWALLSLQSHIPIMSQNSNWISFYGSLLGGIITLLGVSETIKFSKNQYIESERKRILPFITLSYTEIREYIVLPLLSEEEYLVSCSNGNYALNGKMPVIAMCSLKNIGLGSATNIFMELEERDPYGDVNKLLHSSRRATKNALAINESTEDFMLIMDYENYIGFFLKIRFNDLSGNFYEQRILIRPIKNITKAEKTIYIISHPVSNPIIT